MSARKSALITVRVTQDSKAKLTREAHAAGLRLGELVRHRVERCVDMSEVLAELRQLRGQQARLWLATAADEEARAEIQRICAGVA